MKPLLTTFLGPLPIDIDAARKANPHQCDLWNAAGCASYNNGDFQSALAHFSHAVVLSDQYHHYIHYECSAAFLIHAKFLARQEKWEEVKKNLDAAIFQDHGNIPALLLRAWLSSQPFVQDGMKDKFLKQIQRYNQNYSQKIVPTSFADAPEYTQALTYDREWGKHIIHPQYLMVVQPVSAFDNVLDLWSQAPEEALKQLTALCTDLSTGEKFHPRGWRVLGQWQFYLKREEAAGQSLAIAIRQHKLWHSQYHRTAASHRLNRAITYEKLGQVVLAWQDAAKASDIDPDWLATREIRDQLGRLACIHP